MTVTKGVISQENLANRRTEANTVANIYSYLDAVSKADTGAAMSKALGWETTKTLKPEAHASGFILIQMKYLLQ